MLIILDKSFLTACPHEVLQSLPKKYIFVITSNLFHEIITSSRNDEPILFSKLLALNNYKVIDHFGTLMKYEFINGEKSKPLNIHFLRQDAFINPKISQNWHEIKQHNLIEIHQSVDEISSGVQNFIELCENTTSFLPNTKILNFIHRSLANINSDITLPLQLFNATEIKEKIPNKTVNYDWAILRKIQICIIYSMLYYKNNGPGWINIISHTNFAHDYHDSQVCSFATLADYLASNDANLNRIYKFATGKDAVTYLDGKLNFDFSGYQQN